MANSLGLDFDFEKFAINAIKAIDEIRSYGNNDSKKPIESRINAFYRAIGLPAIEGVKKIEEKQVGNIFSEGIGGLGIDKPVLEALGERESGFDKEVEKDEYKNLLHFNNRSIKDNLDKRIRGKMKPTVVNAGIQIYPQSKRVSIAFADEDDLDIGGSGDKLKRPLLESIIYARLKGLGVVDREQQKKIQEDFNASFGLTGAEIAVDTNNANIEIAKTLRMAIITSANRLAEAIQKAMGLADRVEGKYEYPKGDISAQNPSNSGESIEAGTIDLQELYIKEKEKTKQAFLTMLEFSDDSGSDKKNAVDSILLSGLVSILSSDEKIKKDKKSVNVEKEKALSEIKKSIKTMNLVTGTFSGISGIDILIVTNALFEIDMHDLLGLLNDDAIKNLRRVVDKKNQEITKLIDERSTVAYSLEILNTKILELYDYTNNEIQQSKNKNKKAKDGGA